MKKSIVILLAAGMVAGAQANLLTDGDFSNGIAEWTKTGVGWSAKADANASDGLVAQMWVAKTSSSTFRTLYQSVPATAGHEYSGSVSFVDAIWTAVESEAWLQFRFLDASSALIQQVQSAHHIPAVDSGWGTAYDSTLSLADVVAPAGTASIRYSIVVKQNTPSPEALTNDGYRFDTAALTSVIPEPATIGMVASGLGVLLVRRKFMI
jgi:hypothetical protein